MKALLDFFSLTADPFSDTPDTSFLYSSATHREAFATLLWAINSNRGFVGLTAKPGMGKTTLVFKLMSELNHSATTAFVFQTQADPDNMLRHLVADLGLSPEGNHAQIHGELNRFLKHQAKIGKRVILIVDEAQNLQDSVLEMLRLISDFETEQRKLVQFVLSGQSQLAERLASPSLEQLRQRIAAIARLEPFDEQEVARYLQHRLTIARRTGPPLFSDDAVQLIAEASRGIPREINSIAFSALCIAFAMKQPEIDAQVVQEAIDDRNLSLISNPARTRPRSVGTKTETIAAALVANSHAKERRVSGRRSADFSYVRSTKQQVGLIVNIGPGGAALWVSAPDDWGDSEIQFRLPGSEHALEVKGSIVWRRESQGLVGLAFSDVPSFAQTQLHSWTAAGELEHAAQAHAVETQIAVADPQNHESKVTEDEASPSELERDETTATNETPNGSTYPLSKGSHTSTGPLSILNPELKSHSKLFRKLLIARARKKP